MLCHPRRSSNITDEDVEGVEEAIMNCRSDKLGTNLSNTFTLGLQQVAKQKLKMVSEKGRTAALWVQYHHLVQLVKDFIVYTG